MAIHNNFNFDDTLTHRIISSAKYYLGGNMNELVCLMAISTWVFLFYRLNRRQIRSRDNETFFYAAVTLSCLIGFLLGTALSRFIRAHQN